MTAYLFGTVPRTLAIELEVAELQGLIHVASSAHAVEMSR